MEDLLEVYHRPLDPARPLISFDEASKQLVKETRSPIPAAPVRLAPTRTDRLNMNTTGRRTCL